MFVSALLMAAASGTGCGAAGEILDVTDATARVCVGRDTAAGQVYHVRRLGPSDGAPGRLPFVQWSKIGKVRIDSIGADRVADATIVSGRVGTSDRVMMD